MFFWGNLPLNKLLDTFHWYVELKRVGDEDTAHKHDFDALVETEMYWKRNGEANLRGLWEIKGESVHNSVTETKIAKETERAICFVKIQGSFFKS